jgi:Ni/Co efflux regulator RcnB
MKKVMVAVIASAAMLATGSFSTQVFAQDTSTAAKPATKKPVKKAEKHTVEHKRDTRHAHRETRRTAPRKEMLVPYATAIPAGAEKWNCGDAESMYLSGNMARDAILTMNWKGRDYKLPREVTTTGADRFYDAASGMDLVVIPTKAMLFMDKGDRTRLADECKTVAMAQQGALAPTQSNELMNMKK